MPFSAVINMLKLSTIFWILTCRLFSSFRSWLFICFSKCGLNKNDVTHVLNNNILLTRPWEKIFFWSNCNTKSICQKWRVLYVQNLCFLETVHYRCVKFLINFLTPIWSHIHKNKHFMCKLKLSKQDTWLYLSICPDNGVIFFHSKHACQTQTTLPVSKAIKLLKRPWNYLKRRISENSKAQ